MGTENSLLSASGEGGADGPGAGGEGGGLMDLHGAGGEGGGADGRAVGGGGGGTDGPLIIFLLWHLFLIHCGTSP